jgi:predicted TIM-barrel fold metal-dependent hydrolase
VVLNHCGGPLGIGPYQGRWSEVFKAWREDISALASHDNVVVKLGGMAMPRFGFGFHEMDTPVSSVILAKAWAPYIEACVTAFGIDRCMFESNFPVDKISCSYVAVWNAFKHVTKSCSAAEKAALFSLTATQVYLL